MLFSSEFEEKRYILKIFVLLLNEPSNIPGGDDWSSLMSFADALNVVFLVCVYIYFLLFIFIFKKDL